MLGVSTCHTHSVRASAASRAQPARVGAAAPAPSALHTQRRACAGVSCRPQPAHYRQHQLGAPCSGMRPARCGGGLRQPGRVCRHVQLVTPTNHVHAQRIRTHVEVAHLYIYMYQCTNVFHARPNHQIAAHANVAALIAEVAAQPHVQAAIAKLGGMEALQHTFAADSAAARDAQPKLPIKGQRNVLITRFVCGVVGVCACNVVCVCGRVLGASLTSTSAVFALVCVYVLLHSSSLHSLVSHQPMYKYPSTHTHTPTHTTYQPPVRCPTSTTCRTWVISSAVSCPPTCMRATAACEAITPSLSVVPTSMARPPRPRRLRRA